MAEEVDNFISVVNCSDWLGSEDLVHEIIGKDNLSCEKSSTLPNSYPWKIDNKYYTANVKFLVTKAKQPEELKDQKFSAFIVVFDSTEKSFDLVNQWLTYIKLHDASVLLLVGSKSGSDAEENINEKKDSLSRLQVVEWCIKHGFEFVDLNEEIDPEDDFPDTVGIARIIQALAATEWPSLQMKDHESGKPPLAMNNIPGPTVEPNTLSNSSISNNETTDEGPLMSELNTFREMIGGMSSSENNDDSSFEGLFAQMQVLKGKASNLPSSERKAYAEQVALAFWHAIGGDEEEIEDLNE